jgi:hypothetical protein
VLHPQQFAGVPPAGTRQPQPAPLGHQVAMPAPAKRDLQEYDQRWNVAAPEVAA